MVLKLGAVTTAYNEEAIISATINCLAPFVDKHLVMLSDRPYYGDPGPKDKTEEICNNLGAEVVIGTWQEHEQRNIALSLMKEFDWLLMFDADELMTMEDLRELLNVIEDTKDDALAIISKVYWHSPDYRLDPYPGHHKIIATRPTVEYYDQACFNGSYRLLEKDNAFGITHHHLSYSSPKDILSKVLHYGHADEFNGKKWFFSHFVNWRPGMKAIQPFGTEWDVVYDPIPDELRALL